MKTSQKKYILFFLGMSFFTSHLFSQNEKNFWYFGNKAGIDFNTAPPAVVNNGMLSTQEGCAAISDKITGQLLFYTNGVSVLNSSHQVMSNGNGLFAGPSATQSSIIVPDPANNLLYYLFTVADFAGSNGATFGGLAYSVVDMSLNSGLGNVTTKNQVITSVDTVAEKITAVNHCNGKDYWVIVHRWHTNEFYSFQVSTTGIAAPVISGVGTVYQSVSGSNNEAIGCLKASPNGKRLAAVTQINRLLELYDFNNSTGVVSNALTIPYNGNAGEQPYGVSFSPDNSKVYISVYNILDSSRVLQYDLSSGVQATIASSQMMVGYSPAFFPLGSLQLGPNGKIYISRAGSLIDAINNPNLIGAACNYIYGAVNVSPKSNQWGLPNFIDADASTVLSVTLGNDTTLCGNQLTLNSNVTQGMSYTWSTGATTQNISALTSGLYWLQVDNGNCFLRDSINVAINNLPVVNAGTDSSICAGASITVNASSSAGRYSWTPANGLSCTNCPAPIATPTGSTTYILHSADSITGCLSIDSVRIHVDLTPVANVGPDDSICQGHSLTLFAAGGNSYLWSTTETTPNINIQPTILTTYSVVVSNGSCRDTDYVAISVLPIPVANASKDTQIVKGASVTLSAAGSGTYNWYSPNGLSCTTCQFPTASPGHTTKYYLVVTGTNGCTEIDSVLITVLEGPCEDIFIPNVFSPNGDGQNDIFFVKGSCIKNIHTDIYNRWGQKIADSDNVDNIWDGTFKGAALSSDVFVYKISAQLSSGEEIIKNGNVTLLK